MSRSGNTQNPATYAPSRSRDRSEQSHAQSQRERGDRERDQEQPSFQSSHYLDASTTSANTRKRASHAGAVTASRSGASHRDGPLISPPANFDVYQHPKVLQYRLAHPNRSSVPAFGNYLLLQILGEGEFGKVKLGVGMQWGEEVAVKLIRTNTPDGPQRIQKTNREIETLAVSVEFNPVLNLTYNGTATDTSEYCGSRRCGPNRQVYWPRT